MELHLTLTGRRDLSGQVYRQLRGAIADGRLRPGDALPPSRELARRLAVSRNTVNTAYVRLAAEGFLSGRVGSGTYVSESAAPARPARRAPAGVGIRARDVWAAMPPPAPLAHEPAFDFRVGVPDARLFPLATWRRLIAQELRPSRVRSASYGDPSGEARLRQAIARHLGVSRSVVAGPDDVMITAGAQQALDLVGRVLVEPGTCVAVEDPGYPMVRLLFESMGARIVPVEVDAEGLVVDALPAAAKLVYVTPSHQFPLGTAMSLSRRHQLLAWAERHGSVVIEDDYDSEFRFGGRPLEPLQCLDRIGVVVYVGSFSKVLLPSLRLGYLVAPASLRAAIRSARLVSDWYGPVVLQGALARFIEEGALARHVRKARREYQARRERLERALAREMGDRIEVIPGAAGLHLSATFRDARTDSDEVARRALGAGVAAQSLSSFSTARGTTSGLALGYGAIATSRVDEGIRRLAACL